MTRLRPLLTLAAPLATVALLGGALSPASSARTANDICLGSRPIPAAALADGVAPGCSLAGRTVVAGHLRAVVPPDGMSVAGTGIGGAGAVRGIQVDNVGGVVRATVGAPASTGRHPVVAARDAGACQDRTFHLYGVRHHWRTRLHWKINVSKAPNRYHKRTLVKQIRNANANMRLGRNTCGKPHIAAPRAIYGGRTRVDPNIRPGTNDSATCGHFNHKNVVGFGRLPGLLFGWTCVWWSSTGPLQAVDIMLGKQKEMVTNLPKSCSNTWDFEGIATHEWGHGYGMAHTGPGHKNLTMQHLATPCSTYQRTLGLGDWLGMKKMYGKR